MPRYYVRQTDKGKTPKEVMQRAVQAVKGGAAVRQVAREYGIARSTLNNNIKKAMQEKPLEPNYQHSKVFNSEQEASLAEYLKSCSRMFHGLTTLSTKRLAYEMAAHNNIKTPASWEDNKAAGREWLMAFLKRHQHLSIRQPEATSLARATAFNRHNVNTFYDILGERISSLAVTGRQIYNLDETGLTTVQKVPKVIAPKGLKQVGQVTSRERGELVTMCAMISASGQSIPPVYIFPRKNYKDYFLHGAPEGSLGLANPSGWMNAEMFVRVVKHFVYHTRPSEEMPVILVMDNHESHISYDVLQLAKDNHVHIVTLPPHTSNKTQPLDRSVFGPLKLAYNKLADSWMMRNVGKPLTIYEIAGLSGEAWTKAATPENIMAGFKASGVWPFDRDVFTDDDFLPSEITNRPDPAILGAKPIGTPPLSGAELAPTPSTSGAQPAPTPSTSGAQHAPTPSTSGAQPAPTPTPSTSGAQPAPTPTPSTPGAQPAPTPSTSGAQLAPTPSTSGAQPAPTPSTSGAQHAPTPSTSGAQPAPTPTPSTSGAQPAPTPTPSTPGAQPAPTPSTSGAQLAPTPSTPDILPAFISPHIFKGFPKAQPRKETGRGRKKGRSMCATSTPELERIKKEAREKAAKKNKSANAKSCKKLKFNDSTDSDTDMEIVLDDDSDFDMSGPDSDSERAGAFVLKEVEHVSVNEYVLCEYAGKKNVVYYVGIVRKEVDEDGDVEVEFLRKSDKIFGKFVKPHIEDIASIPIKDIKSKLTREFKSGTTSRAQDGVFFKEKLSELSLR